MERERGKDMQEEDEEDTEEAAEGGGWTSLSVGEGGRELHGLELRLESLGTGPPGQGDPEVSPGRPGLGYAQ